MKKKKQESYRPKKRRGTVLIPLITLTVLVVILSAAAAGLWQLLDPVDYIPPKGSSTADSVSEPADTSSGSSASGSGSGSSQGLPSTSSSPEGSSTPQSDAPTEYEVAKNAVVDVDYFDDALFIGDSLTEGIKLYDVMSNAKVLSAVGINLGNIFTKEIIPDGDGKITIVEAAKKQPAGKIYIMMGANGMAATKEDFLEGYGRLVDAMKQAHPDADIYVQSILPVTAAYASGHPDYANVRIDDFNVGIRKMAQDKGVFYLNVATAFKDEAGALPNEASPKDGIHFGKSRYEDWFIYLRTHTVSKE
ncbi:MAG: GDSL-type esterase/lipase family protein [Angelakisella sp.]